MGYKYYNQNDYGGYYDGNTFANAACGPTSLAMLLHKRNVKWNPKKCAKWLHKRGYDPNGTSWIGMLKLAQYAGCEAYMYGNQVRQYGIKGGAAEKAWKKKIQAGGKGILLMGPSIFTTSGHFITVIKTKKIDGVWHYKIWDPYSRNLCKWFRWDTFNGKVLQFYWINPEWKPAKSNKELNGYKVGKTYTAQSKRPIKAGHAKSKKKVGTLKKGEKVKFTYLYRNKKSLWGKIGKDKWVFIKHNDGTKKVIK